MIKENTVTPNIRIIEAIMRSEELTGVKSPKPMVDKVVMAKYQKYQTNFDQFGLVIPVSSVSVSVSISGSGCPIMAVLIEIRFQSSLKKRHSD